MKTFKDLKIGEKIFIIYKLTVRITIFEITSITLPFKHFNYDFSYCQFVGNIIIGSFESVLIPEKYVSKSLYETHFLYILADEDLFVEILSKLNEDT